MIKWVNEILLGARSCFSRYAPFTWFVVTVTALMIGQEHVGVTSIVRELCIDPNRYYGALRFFRSKAWNIDTIRGWWIQVVLKSGVLHLENGMPVQLGDGTKKSKEGRKMPCVKRLCQESENSAKPSFIFGHMFGMAGVLAGTLGKLFCVPLGIKIHDGDHAIHQWDAEASGKPEPKDESHVVRMIRDASGVAGEIGKSLLLLDAYYLSVPALVALKEEAANAGKHLLSIVVRAKKNATAYELPVRKPGRGRPPVKGESVKLMGLFKAAKTSSSLVQTTIMMYGKEEQVSFMSRDLLWGKQHYQLLRFVVAQISGSMPIILASNDLTLGPAQMIRLYSYRFKIECCFFNLKNTVAGFAYRFWSTAMPKLNRYAPTKLSPLESVVGANDRRLVSAAFRATQGYVMMACIAVGLLQICSLRFAQEINASPIRWLRTRTNSIPTEATTADFMRKTIFKHFGEDVNLPIIHIINRLQPSHEDTKHSLVA